VPVQQYLAYKLGASQLYLIGYAGVFLVIMLLLPRGILPSLQDRLERRRAGPRGRGIDGAQAGSRPEGVVA